MGYKFGGNSIKKLKTCHVALQLLMGEAIKTSPIDFTIVCGHRGKEEENKAFRTGNSKLQ